MNPVTLQCIEAALKAAGARAPLEKASPLSGGDINEAYLLEFGDGRRLFAKTRSPAPPGMFAAEAEGLEWLRAAFEGARPEQALRLPEVIVHADEPRAAFLVLEYLKPGRPRPDFDERLGRGLAHLHQSGAPHHGLYRDNFIGPLPQSNRRAPTWAEFYRSQRLAPQLELDGARRCLPTSLRRRLDTLLENLESWLGPEEAPSRLHGDLWSGNLHVGPDGAPVLLDPSVYGGQREMDLAMMRLFGGFSERAFAAYEEAFPTAPGCAERVPLCQLYPLLVHVNLFGSAYVPQLARAVGRYVP